MHSPSPLSLLVLSLLALGLPFSGDAHGRGGGGMPATLSWHTDTAAAAAESRQTGKPILVVFRCES